MTTDFDNYIADQYQYAVDRTFMVWTIQRDLYDAALSLGQTDAQARTKIDTLFTTFAAEWSIYVLTGSPSITTAILTDVTIPWLDTDVSGTSIRTRLANRLG